MGWLSKTLVQAQFRNSGHDEVVKGDRLLDSSFIDKRLVRDRNKTSGAKSAHFVVNHVSCTEQVVGHQQAGAA
ncbi:hypothetical protein AVEN_17832-1, partial [Araneus ventricosus]